MRAKRHRLALSAQWGHENNNKKKEDKKRIKYRSRLL